MEWLVAIAGQVVHEMDYPQLMARPIVVLVADSGSLFMPDEYGIKGRPIQQSAPSVMPMQSCQPSLVPLQEKSLKESSWTHARQALWRSFFMRLPWKSSGGFGSCSRMPE